MTPKMLQYILAGIVAGLAVAAIAYVATRPTSDRRRAVTEVPITVVVGDSPAPRLRVADLMSRAGCQGGAIETQLYAYETGRCRIGGIEVTIAVFDSAANRDQWVEAGRSFGGSFAVGDGWAAGSFAPDAAAAMAAALGGTVP